MKPIPLALSTLLVLSLAACDKAPSPAAPAQPTQPEQPAAAVDAPTPPGIRIVNPEVGPGKGKPIALVANQSISGGFDAGSDGQLVAFGVRIGNYFKSADGSLSLKLCVEAACQDARMPLAGSRDNDYLVFQLPEPVTLSGPQRIDYTLTRSGDATNRVAVWAYPTREGQPGLIDASGTQTTLAPRLALHFRE